MDARYEAEDIRQDEVFAKDKACKYLYLQQKNDGNESAPASKKTIETIKAAERLIEAIELVEEEQKNHQLYLKVSPLLLISTFYRLLQALEVAEKEIAKELVTRESSTAGPLIAPPLPNPLLLGLSPTRYLLKVVKQIRSADLEETLMVIPVNNVIILLHFIHQWIKEVT